MPTSANSREIRLLSWTVTRREVMVSLAGFSIVVLTLVLGRVGSSSVVLITPNNETVVFPDVEASFSSKVQTSGILGLLSAAYPSNACVPLQAFMADQTFLPSFILIERGDCDFVTKVQFAQDAGYAAAIVYNNVNGLDLVTMSGNGFGIEIPAVFISKEAGEILLQYVGDVNAQLYLLSALENTTRSVMAVSFILLLAVSAVLSTFFFLRRQHRRQNGSQQHLHETSALSKHELKAFPVSVFSRKDNGTSETCAICLEEYVNREKLRVLPCSHEFHVSCIDQWLTTHRPFCPICKRDARTKDAKAMPSACTPLLASVRQCAEAQPSGTSTSEPTQRAPDDIC